MGKGFGNCKFRIADCRFTSDFAAIHTIIVQFALDSEMRQSDLPTFQRIFF